MYLLHVFAINRHTAINIHVCISLYQAFGSLVSSVKNVMTERGLELN